MDYFLVNKLGVFIFLCFNKIKDSSECQITQVGLICMVFEFLTGIGFTMSLFVGNLAFVENMQYMDGVKIGVLTGSLLSQFLDIYLILLYIQKINVNKKINLCIYINVLFFKKLMSANYEKKFMILK